MEIESKSFVIKRVIGLSLIIEFIVFFIAFILCSSPPTLNDFLSNLFLVGLAFIIIGPLFFGNGVANDRESINFQGYYPAKPYQPVSAFLMVACVWAGIIAIAITFIMYLILSNY
jgi:hypothetical protein